MYGNELDEEEVKKKKNIFTYIHRHSHIHSCYSFMNSYSSSLCEFDCEMEMNDNNYITKNILNMMIK